MRRPIPWRQIVLSVGAIVVIVWRVPFPNLRAAFRTLDWHSLLLAGCCFQVLLATRAYKWHCLMAAVGKVRPRQSLRTLLGGFALGLITPGRLGELGRCMFVRKHERIHVAVLTLLDRLLDLWALLTLIGASLFLLVPPPAAVFGVAIWLVLLPVMLGSPNLLAHLARRIERVREFQTHASEVASGLPPSEMVRYSLLALAALTAELASFFFLLRAFYPAGFGTAVATYPYIVLAGDLPISFGGVGLREGAAALLLTPYAVPSGAAIDAALLWFVFAILLPALLGIAWLITERVRSQFRFTQSQAHRPEWLPSQAAQVQAPLPADSAGTHLSAP